MSRELKFRAWNPKEKQFIYSITKDGKDRLGWFFANVKGLPIQQYTGLKDLNGKDIYEGDTGFWVGDNLNPKRPCYIKYIGRSFWMMHPSDDQCPPAWGNYFDNFEIVGNIFEKPKLLNQ